MADEPKPTIDERLEALTHSLELLQLENKHYREEQKRLDERERRAREAILQGIITYLRVIAAEEQ